MYINNQVNPTQGVDFSKIRKAQKGTKITKFQTPAKPLTAEEYAALYANNNTLVNWNDKLNYANAGDTIVGEGNSRLHRQAGDLQTAYKSNQAYTSDKNRIGYDINVFYKKWKQDNSNGTPEEFVNAYNTIAEQIRQYQTKGHKYNETGATAHNDNFHSLFSSRSDKEDGANLSADDAYIGWQEKLKDIYGSSTFLRRMDRYAQEFENLDEAGKAARLHDIIGDDGNTPLFKVYKKANGDIGLLPNPDANPQNEGDPNSNPQGNPEGNPGENPKDPNKTPNYLEEELKKLEQTPARRPAFTSPIYNGASTALGLIGAQNSYNAQKDKAVALQEGPQYNSREVDTYTTNKNLNQQLANQQYAATQPAVLGSDLTQNMTHIANVADNVLKNIEQIKANEEANRNAQREQSIKIRNANNEEGVKTANTNRDRLVANRNYRRDLRAQLEEIKASLKASNLQANVTDWKKYKHDLAQNADMRQKALNELRYQVGAKNLYDQYEKDWEDKNWYDEDKAMTDAFYSDAFTKKLSQEDQDEYTAAEGNIEAMRALIKKYATNSGYKDVFNPWIEDFTNKKKAAYKTVSDRINSEMYKVNALNAQGDYIIGNDYWGYPGSLSIGNYQFGQANPSDLQTNPKRYYPRGAYSYKQGGRFDAYIKAHRDMQKSADKNTNLSIKQINANLKRELDSLDREKMLLLKEMFK